MIALNPTFLSPLRYTIPPLNAGGGGTTYDMAIALGLVSGVDPFTNTVNFVNSQTYGVSGTVSDPNSIGAANSLALSLTATLLQTNTTDWANAVTAAVAATLTDSGTITFDKVLPTLAATAAFTGAGGFSLTMQMALAAAAGLIPAVNVGIFPTVALAGGAAAGTSNTLDAGASLQLASISSLALSNAMAFQSLLSLAGQTSLTPAANLVMAAATAMAIVATLDIASSLPGHTYDMSLSLQATAALQQQFQLFLNQTLGLTGAAALTASQQAALAAALTLQLNADIQRLSQLIANNVASIQGAAAAAIGGGTVIQMALALNAAGVLNALLKPPLVACVRFDGSLVILWQNTGTISIT